MGIVSDVLGYKINGEIVCRECITDDESSEITQEDVITRDEVENSDDFYFCDRCKKQI